MHRHHHPPRFPLPTRRQEITSRNGQSSIRQRPQWQHRRRRRRRRRRKQRSRRRRSPSPILPFRRGHHPSGVHSRQTPTRRRRQRPDLFLRTNSNSQPGTRNSIALATRSRSPPQPNRRRRRRRTGNSKRPENDARRGVGQIMGAVVWRTRSLEREEVASVRGEAHGRARIIRVAGGAGSLPRFGVRALRRGRGRIGGSGGKEEVGRCGLRPTRFGKVDRARESIGDVAVSHGTIGREQGVVRTNLGREAVACGGAQRNRRRVSQIERRRVGENVGDEGVAGGVASNATIEKRMGQDECEFGKA
mmetsp:Transcript_5605/g.10116  ORF Transcript_5605/g.10116 Transcript_5605/m.10116 type:complete len:304 (-) Transcript_5605:235-1146(-)